VDFQQEIANSQFVLSQHRSATVSRKPFPQWGLSIFKIEGAALGLSA
jgi:hypothetical protein